MQDEKHIELIDYIDVMWKRRNLITGGTIFLAGIALVVSLLMPQTYKVYRTLKIGQLPVPQGEKIYVVDSSSEVARPLMAWEIESREAVIDRLKDHRLLTMTIENLQLGLTVAELEGLVSIDAKTKPDVRYAVQADDAEKATRMADLFANYIIKTHEPIFEKGMRIAKEYEAELLENIHSVETETSSLTKIIHEKIRGENVDPTAIALLQATIGERERNLAGLRRELKGARLSRVGSANTFVIAADTPPRRPVKPRVKLNVLLATTMGFMGFTFLAFFLEYLASVRRSERENR